MTTKASSITHALDISSKILLIHNQRVLIDADLAALYGVTTKRLNEQVKCNNERFPLDFMFQLTANEKEQVVANCDHLKNLKYSSTNPYVFTEHGAIMAASVLNTKYAIEVSLLVVRTFVKLRQMMSTQKELKHKLIELENRLDGHDETLQTLVSAYTPVDGTTYPKEKTSYWFCSLA
jgi:hypothetical protein